MPSEFCSCPFCKADAALRKTVVLKDGVTVKKVWFCKNCSHMFVTATQKKAQDEV